MCVERGSPLATTPSTRERVARLEDLTGRATLSPDETNELQDLARHAADLVCTVESVKTTDQARAKEPAQPR